MSQHKHEDPITEVEIAEYRAIKEKEVKRKQAYRVKQATEKIMLIKAVNEGIIVTEEEVDAYLATK